MSDQTLRARYMNHEITFHDYYGALVEYIGESSLRRCLPVDHTPEEWRALIEVDPHLNNVPLRRWDAYHGMVLSLLRGGPSLVAITGPGGWSLSDSVCVLKETARRYAGETT